MRGMAWVAVLWAMAAAAAWAAGPAIERVDAGAFPRVTVSFAISGATASNAPAAGDLAVREDGAPVAGLELSTDSELAWISLIFDVSGSMVPSMDDAKRAAKAFVEEAPSGFRAELIKFSDRPEQVVGFTPDRAELKTAIGRLEPHGATALMDALQDGLLDLAKVKDGRKVVVAFTDGRDQNAAGTAPQSRTTAKEVVREARKAGVPLYLIGLGDTVQRPLMEKMAAVTGGRYFHAPDRRDLMKLFREVAGLLSARFTVTYTSPKPAPDGTLRTVEIASTWAPSPGKASGPYRAPKTLPVAAARGAGAGKTLVGHSATGSARTGVVANTAVDARTNVKIGLDVQTGADVAVDAARVGVDAARVGVEAARVGVEATHAGAEAVRAGAHVTDAALDAARGAKRASDAGDEARREADEAAAAAALGADGADAALDHAGKALDQAGKALDALGGNR